jgi:hypothetical protein
MLTAGRNRSRLTDRQIVYCESVWALLAGDTEIALNTDEATHYGSPTRFDEVRGIVVLGADVLPGTGIDANSRMSVLACLAHELAHAERFITGYRRPTVLPDVLLDGAETSVRASFTPRLRPSEREALVEDARDRLIEWLALHRQGGRRGQG